MVNQRRNDLHTATMQSIDTMREMGGRGGGGHLSAKSRPDKNYKISVQIMDVIHQNR